MLHQYASSGALHYPGHDMRDGVRARGVSNFLVRNADSSKLAGSVGGIAGMKAQCFQSADAWECQQDGNTAARWSPPPPCGTSYRLMRTGTAEREGGGERERAAIFTCLWLRVRLRKTHETIPSIKIDFEEASFQIASRFLAQTGCLELCPNNTCLLPDGSVVFIGSLEVFFLVKSSRALHCIKPGFRGCEPIACKFRV